MMSAFSHIPVMLHEVIDFLNCVSGGVYIDGTVGGGGHAYEILNRTSPDGILIGIDQDDDALAESRKQLSIFGDRCILVKGNFGDIKKIFADLNIPYCDGIMLDLGVSSYQLDKPERGFSFSAEAPLDMRMDRGSKVNAYDLVNVLPEQDLKRILREYGEERMAGRIAAAIVREREKAPIGTTRELADLVLRTMPFQRKRQGIHPATRTFQALRIAVNDELNNLRRALHDGVEILKSGGIMAVISFHSLEDRIVKEFFRSGEGKCTCPPDFPLCRCERKQILRIMTRKPVMPDLREIRRNPRSRSARLRVAMRV